MIEKKELEKEIENAEYKLMLLKAFKSEMFPDDPNETEETGGCTIKFKTFGDADNEEEEEDVFGYELSAVLTLIFNLNMIYDLNHELNLDVSSDGITMCFDFFMDGENILHIDTEKIVPLKKVFDYLKYITEYCNDVKNDFIAPIPYDSTFY